MRQLKIFKQITSRENDSLDTYLSEISKVALITAEDEVHLTQQIRSGDQAAFEKLVKANLRFVVSVAKQYHHHGLSLSDLINEGNVGLIKAAQRFDETRGFKFISYAVWWIRQSILQALAEQSRIVRIPMNRIGMLSKMNRTLAELEQQFQREPSADELADSMALKPEDIYNTKIAASRQLSIDAPFSQYEDNSLLDVLEDTSQTPDSGMMGFSLQQEVQRSLSSLTAREADVITQYYGLNGTPALSMEDIGEMFGLTRERVRQIKEKGLRRLRSATRSRALRSFLG
jgi:RNA polymerase primary sigma factor